MRNLALGMACVFIVVALVFGNDTATTDLKNLNHSITKEPAYTSAQPRYGLLVVGAKMNSRIWLVLDKSKPDADRYDVLYADLNGNGDLTDAAERFVIKPDEDKDLRFRLPDFKDSATGAAHTAFSLRVDAGPTPNVMVSMKWRDGFKFGGGYPEDPDNGYLKFGDKPATAPILWANGDSPFRFQRWYSGKLTIGAADDFKVFIGQPGVGANSFCAYQQHMLPNGEGVHATLIYTDATGKEMRTEHRLKDRC